MDKYRIETEELLYIGSLLDPTSETWIDCSIEFSGEQARYFPASAAGPAEGGNWELEDWEIVGVWRYDGAGKRVPMTLREFSPWMRNILERAAWEFLQEKILGERGILGP